MFALTDDASWEVIKKLAAYQQTIEYAAEKFEPSQIAKYAVSLAQTFNRYYGNTRILEENEQLEARIALVNSVAIVLKDALGLLGIKAPDQM